MVTVPDPTPLSFFLLPAIPLGPIWLFYHCIFRQLDLARHKLYLDTGVECRGITTHRHQIIRRTNFIETGREYLIRFVYQPPGESSFYATDFVQVSRQQFATESFNVLVLPGQPDSGVPKSTIMKESQRCNKYCIGWMNVFSVVWTAFLVYLFGTVDCTTDSSLKTACVGDSCDTCELDWVSVGTSLVIVFLIGLIGSAVHYCSKRKQLVPGTMTIIEPVNQTSVPAGNASVATSSSGNIPIAEVVSIDSGGDLHLMVEGDSEEGTPSDVASQPIMLAAAEPTVDDEHSNDDTPRAKVLELV